MRYGGWTQVSLSIVQAIAVNMVADKRLGDADNLVVHPNLFPFLAIREILPTSGIRTGGAFGEEPFVLYEAWIVVWVDDCELAFS